jgi:ribonuclease HI
MTCNVLLVYADASVQPGATGLGVAIHDEHGQLIAWRNKATSAMTCNEAEYAALIFALEQARDFSPREVRVFSDSRLVVEQMRGYIRVNSHGLRPLHRRARELAQRFEQVTFTHVPRDRNQLADAIANEAIASIPIHPHSNGRG